MESINNDFKTKKINNFKVTPLNIAKPKQKYKGEDIIKNPFANIYICASKESGKTTIVDNILENCIDKDTEVIFFVNTIYKDDSYREILKRLDDAKIQHRELTEIIDVENNTNYLKNFIINLREQIEDEKEKELDEKMLKSKEFKEYIKENEKMNPGCEIDLNENDIIIKFRRKKEKKYLTPKLFFVFDDISGELQNNMITVLLKQNRHFKSKCIISTQSITDVHRKGRTQFNIFILLGGHNDQQLDYIYEAASLSISKNKFYELYKDATKEKYNFLYIDKDHNKFRKNFNEEYII